MMPIINSTVENAALRMIINANLLMGLLPNLTDLNTVMKSMRKKPIIFPFAPLPNKNLPSPPPFHSNSRASEGTMIVESVLESKGWESENEEEKEAFLLSGIGVDWSNWRDDCWREKENLLSLGPKPYVEGIDVDDVVGVEWKLVFSILILFSFSIVIQTTNDLGRNG